MEPSDRAKLRTKAILLSDEEAWRWMMFGAQVMMSSLQVYVMEQMMENKPVNCGDWAVQHWQAPTREQVARIPLDWEATHTIFDEWYQNTGGPE